MITLSTQCIFHYLSEGFSCDEAQNKAKETLPNGQYLLTNENVSFKVSKARYEGDITG